MSIVNVAESPRRAVMLTDTSLYDAKGTIIGFDRKSLPVEAWNGAITARGNLVGLILGLRMAERFASFDEFIARSAPQLEREYREEVAAGYLTAQPMIEIHAVGWSERYDQAKAFMLVGGALKAFQHRQFVWSPLREVDSSGILYLLPSERALWRLHRQGAQPSVDFTAETFDPIKHGLPLIEEQRRMTVEAGMGLPKGIHCIGGELWLTVVDRDGTRQDVIHEWPDVVGKPIVPGPIDEAGLPEIVPEHLEGWTFAEVTEALATGLLDPETLEPIRRRPAAPPPLTGLSRQQRRAAKAQARKVRAHAA